MAKNSLVLYYDYEEKFEFLTDEQLGKLMRLVFHYEKTQELPEFDDPAVRVAFGVVKYDLDQNRAKYEQQCERNKRNRNQQQREVTSGDESSQHVTDNDSDNDTVNDTDSDSEEDNIPCAPDGRTDSYQSLFDYYLSLDLIKHKKLTQQMRNAIDVAKRRCSYTFDNMKELLRRHEVVVAASEKDECPVPKRGITEFFGQKAYQATHLICSEYDDDGVKWRRYQAGAYGKNKASPKRGGNMPSGKHSTVI